MKDSDQPVFVNTPDRLPLVADPGYLGLRNSSSPEMTERVRSLFDHLNGRLGFANDARGREHQKYFNALLRYVYPEVMIDLADIVYVQHERPMVFLNREHIDMNFHADSLAAGSSVRASHEEMEFLFHRLAQTLRQDEALFSDPVVVRLLAESYSYYIFQTGNFPWEETIPDSQTADRPVLDVATGLAGFGLIHAWPEHFPHLVLTDKMPFILESLEHYKRLLGKQNVEILRADFPSDESPGLFGSIWANKFLHHLRQGERQTFLRWAWQHLEPGGVLNIVDADLELRILQQAKDPGFRGKLIPGYLETLVEIEENFCKTLVDDVRQAGFKVLYFDSHEYLDETDAYSLCLGDEIKLKFSGFEIFGEK
ncbi:MAG: class I SAM-dependent methyltransferase [Nitrospinales bacterium]